MKDIQNLIDKYKDELKFDLFHKLEKEYLDSFSKDKRKKTGAVYTPPKIIKWIHDKLEQYSPIDLNKTYWDPACGTGRFPLDWYDRLMRHWKEKREDYPNIKDQHEAHRWIVEKCIYFSDIDPFAIRICKLGLFLKDPTVRGLKFNFTCEDTLLMECPDKFDYVAGNPPYQDSKGSSTSNSTLWTKFVEFGINSLNSEGLLGFITPSSWMKPNHKVLKQIRQRRICSVAFEIEGQALPLFFPGVASTFSCWVISNKKGNVVLTELDDLKIDTTCIPYFVPGRIFSIHKKIIFTPYEKFKVESDQQTAYTLKLTKKHPDLSKDKTEHCKYPIRHTNAQTIFSAVKTKNFDDKKVTFSDSGYFQPKYDNGDMGTSQRCYYILVKDEEQGNNLVKILSSRTYQFILNSAKWSGFTDLTVMRSLPYLDINKEWTDVEIYEHFNLTQDEIDIIEKEFGEK